MAGSDFNADFNADFGTGAIGPVTAAALLDASPVLALEDASPVLALEDA